MILVIRTDANEHSRSTVRRDLWNIHTDKYHTTVKKIAHVIE